MLFLSLDENTRVCLSPIRGIEGSDYINASYIDVSFSLIIDETLFVNIIFFASMKVSLSLFFGFLSCSQ